MRLLGLDIGERRIGVAISDPTGRVATPVTVMDAVALASDSTPLRRLVDEYEPDRLVVGLPLTMSGDEGPQASRVRQVAELLSSAVGLPLVYVDERLTTSQAERSMSAAGTSSKKRRGSVDMVAASLLLQTYLDGMSAGTSAPSDSEHHRDD